MSIENIGAYSPDIVYGQLTTPFLDKQISINAHTPFDKEKEVQQAFSKADFEKNISGKSFPTFEEMTTFQTQEQFTGVKNELFEFPPKMPEVSSFQASKTNESSGWVYEAIKNGYSPSKAITVGKAQSAYAKILNQEKSLNFVADLNNNYVIK